MSGTEAEAIELVRGPASVLYGQNSPGGIINYSSKRPTAEAFGEVGLSVGSFDRYEAQFDIGGPITEDGVFSYRLTGLSRKGDTHVDFVNDDRVYLAPSVKWAPDDETSLTVFAKYQGLHRLGHPVSACIRNGPAERERRNSTRQVCRRTGF